MREFLLPVHETASHVVEAGPRATTLGREVLALPGPVAVPLRLSISLWLLPDPARLRTPLLEGLLLEWIPPPAEIIQGLLEAPGTSAQGSSP